MSSDVEKNSWRKGLSDNRRRQAVQVGPAGRQVSEALGIETLQAVSNIFGPEDGHVW